MLGLLVSQDERCGYIRLADQEVEDHCPLRRVFELEEVHHDRVVLGGVGSIPESNATDLVTVNGFSFILFRKQAVVEN